MRAVLAACIAAAAAMRVGLLGESLSGDELSTYWIVADNDLGRVLELVESEQEVSPPLSFIAAWAAAQIGDSATWIRVPSLLASLALIPLTWRLGLVAAGERAALGAAAFVALSPFLLYYGVQARAYSFMAALAVGSTIALVRGTQTGRGRWWLVYAACAAAALYAHYTAIFVLAVQVIWSAAARPERTHLLRLAGSTAAVAIAFIPWLGQLSDDQDSFASVVIGITHPFGAQTLLEDLAHWAAGHPYEGLDEVPGTAGLVLILAGVASGLVLSARHLAKARPRLLEFARSPGCLVVLLAVAAPLGTAIASALGDDVVMSRNFSSSTPALAIAIGWLTTSSAGLRGLVPAGLVAVGLATGAIAMQSDEHQRADFDGALAFIEDSGDPGDPILEFPIGTPGPLSHMQGALSQRGSSRPLMRIGLPRYEDQLAASRPGQHGPYSDFDVPTPTTLTEEAVDAARGGRLFALVPGENPFGYKPPSTAGVREILERSFRIAGSRRFPGVPALTVYRFESP